MEDPDALEDRVAAEAALDALEALARKGALLQLVDDAISVAFLEEDEVDGVTQEDGAILSDPHVAREEERRVVERHLGTGEVGPDGDRRGDRDDGEHEQELEDRETASGRVATAVHGRRRDSETLAHRSCLRPGCAPR